ncbi:ORC-CDC6 family AAA ATPase [Dethiobacter alkaliphilus]|uniref:ORC-CDC6 family AAA ATPase n=1 Tax=Dethiobacter alkaliphilus TaxID=427926 RepID=UPI002226F370|nr:hypothetical protein [Dethiobacter alkaliphilus]MCW3490231.1 hypothetical protein [Dethiobacter alkaliphilus]
MGNIYNPFTVFSPEKLDASTAEQLFVEVFSDFPQVRNPGNSLILGARGSGKSMMFRCLLPDVLMLKEQRTFEELDFLAFHVPIRNTQLKIIELERLDRHHASYLINEHFFALTIIIDVLRALISTPSIDLPFSEFEYKEFFEKTYVRRLKLCGSNTFCEFRDTSARDFFQSLYDHALDMHAEFINYILQINPDGDISVPLYNLPLLTYLGFVVPFFEGLIKLPGLPKKNIYLFIDDADNLNKTQTQILNAWLATRTQPQISLKVSAQIGNYKSFLSPNGTLVESPHDYQEVNISDKYTTSKTAYYKRVYEIVEKRLKLSGINVSPEKYFLPYLKQEEAINLEKERLIEVWQKEGKGHRPSDDALRYARPNYIRDLGGNRKSRSKYMYAGLEHLVHLSSGVIRYFLDCTALMFDKTVKEQGIEHAKNCIPYGIQNQVVRHEADRMMFSTFRKLEKDKDKLPGELSKVQKLQNLIFSMGRTFHSILVSERSERRVFSIALTNMPTKEIKDVLDLGVQIGFLHMATIGNKEGTGRTWLYILNRCFAPIFVLDPTGFAGYLFVTNDSLLNAMYKGSELRIFRTDEPEQLTLFEGSESL